MHKDGLLEHIQRQLYTNGDITTSSTTINTTSSTSLFDTSEL